MHPYFNILKIKPTKDEKKIKKAFRKLALKYHPDIAKDDGKMFRELNGAYETILKNLNNPQFFVTQAPPKPQPKPKGKPPPPPEPEVKAGPPRLLLSKYFCEVNLFPLIDDTYWGSVTVPSVYLEEDCLVFCNWPGKFAFKFFIPKDGLTKLRADDVTFSMHGIHVVLQVRAAHHTVTYSPGFT
jgi:hypothetical protein